MDSNVKSALLSFLSSHQLMAIATFGEKPWIATVYYAVDPELHIYFLSSPTSQHGRDIGEKSTVACDIFDSTHSPQFQKEFVRIGVQLTGEAVLLTDEQSIRQGLEVWRNALGVLDEEKYSYENMKAGGIESKIYKVTPKRLKFFHEAIFAEGSAPVFEL